MSLWAGSMWAFQVVDRSLIEHFFGFAVTGSYTSLYDLLVRVYTLLFFPVTLAAHPRIMAAWNRGDSNQATRYIKLVIGLQLVLLLPFVLLNTWLAPYIILRFFPSSSTVVNELILPVALGGALWQIALMAHKPLEMMGRTRLMLVLILCALVSSFVLNYWGLPRYGVVFAGYSYVCSSLFYIVGCLFFSLHAWHHGLFVPPETVEDNEGLD
jgi:O-antigen/teichoic acid export membrane protein